MREKPFFPATLGGLFGLVAVMEGFCGEWDKRRLYRREGAELFVDGR
jgi:hypothetical protein